MAVSDSVSIFAEGTFEEQVIHVGKWARTFTHMFSKIQELVVYITRDKSEEERAAFLKPFQDALEGDAAGSESQRRKVFTMVLGEVKVLGDGSEKGE
jgi:translation initiation factor 3 subunit M